MRERKQTFGFRVPSSLLKKLQYLARLDTRSTGSMLRVLIYDYVEKYEREHGPIRP